MCLYLICMGERFDCMRRDGWGTTETISPLTRTLMDQPQPSATWGTNTHTRAQTQLSIRHQKDKCFSYTVCKFMRSVRVWPRACQNLSSKHSKIERSCQVVFSFVLHAPFFRTVFVCFFPHFTAPWIICFAVHTTQSCWLSACSPSPICVFVFTGTRRKTVFATIKY